MGHVGQKLALGDICLLGLLAHPLDLVDIGLDVGHVQHQDDAALLPAVFVNDLLAVAFVMLPVDGKAPGDAFVEHLLPEVLQLPDILPQLVLGQAGEDLGGGPVIADKPVMVVQGDYPVPQALQHLFGRQAAEVVVAAAPHHNYHHRHGDGQSDRREVEHCGELEHIGHQHRHGQGGDQKDGPILPADLLVQPAPDRPGQGVDGQDIGNHDAGNQEEGIQGAVGDADIVKAVGSGQPLKFPVKQAVPVEKHRGQNEKVDYLKGPQQLFGRAGVAVGVSKPAVAQGDKGGAHIFHRHRCHGGLHGGGGQLQHIAHVLHQRATHNKNQQLLLPGAVSVQQEDQRRENQAYAKAL